MDNFVYKITTMGNFPGEEKETLVNYARTRKVALTMQRMFDVARLWDDTMTFTMEEVSPPAEDVEYLEDIEYLEESFEREVLCKHQ